MPLPQTAPAGLGAGERPRAGPELSPAGPGPALRGVPGHLAPPLCAGGRSHVRLQPPGWAHLADAGRAGAVVPPPPLLTRAGRESGLPCLSAPPLAVTGLGECPETWGHPLRETGSGRSAHAWGPLRGEVAAGCPLSQARQPGTRPRKWPRCPATAWEELAPGETGRCRLPRRALQRPQSPLTAPSSQTSTSASRTGSSAGPASCASTPAAATSVWTRPVPPPTARAPAPGKRAGGWGATSREASEATRSEAPGRAAQVQAP